MSGCTQGFLVIAKGSEKEIELFKEWYHKENDLLAQKYRPNSFKYNSSYSSIWRDKPNEFSFVISWQWHTNYDTYYSIYKTAKKFTRIEFSNTYYIQHNSKRTYQLSTEGFEVYKNGKRTRFIQLPLGTIEWNPNYTSGIPETLFERLLQLKYVTNLLDQQQISGLIKSKLEVIVKRPQYATFKGPIISFSELIDEEQFFIQHLSEFRQMILDLINSGFFFKFYNGESNTESPELSLLSLGLKPYILKSIPELAIHYDIIMKRVDSYAKDLLSGKIKKEGLVSTYSKSNDLYALFSILRENKVDKYSAIYKTMDEIIKSKEDENLPF